MEAKTKRQVLEEWFDRLWTRRDASVIDELRAPGAASYGLAPAPLDTAGMKAFHARVCRLFDDTSVEIRDMLTEGDRVAVVVRFRGSFGGRRFEVPGMGVVVFSEGRVVQAQNLFDVASLMAQLSAGARPATLNDAFSALEEAAR